MANSVESGQGLDALLLAGLLGGQQRASVPDVGDVSSPALSMLQNLVGTSPVFERGRNVGALGQIGRALAPATASVVAAPLVKAQMEAKQEAAFNEAIMEGLRARKLALEGDQIESVLKIDQALLDLFSEAGGQLSQGDKFTLRGKTATFERKGPPYKSQLAGAVEGLSSNVGRLLTSFRVDEQGRLAFQTTPTQQTALQAQEQALVNVLDLSNKLKAAIEADSTAVGFSGALQRTGFGALSQIRNLADIARRNAVDVVQNFGVDESVPPELLDQLFNPQAEDVEVFQTALAFQVAAGLFNQQGREITKEKLRLAQQVIGNTGFFDNSTAIKRRVGRIEQMAAQGLENTRKRLRPAAPMGVTDAFAAPRPSAADRVRELDKSLPTSLSGSGRAEAIFSILQSEGYSLDELRALGGQ